MKKLSTFLFLLITVASFTSTTFAGTSGTIKIATDAAFPPFNYKDSTGAIKGFDIDMTMAACKAAGLECTFVAQDWDGLIPGLLVKKFDAISASMFATDERKKRVSFTDKVYKIPSRFLVKKGSSLKLDKAGLAGKTIAAQRSTVQADFITKEFGDIATISLYETVDQANLDLAAGRISAFLVEVVALNESLLKTDEGKDFEFQGPEYSFGEGVAIAVRKDDKDLQKKLNGGIDQIRKSGEYQKISDKYFGFDIY